MMQAKMASQMMLQILTKVAQALTQLVALIATNVSVAPTTMKYAILSSYVLLTPKKEVVTRVHKILLKMIPLNLSAKLHYIYTILRDFLVYCSLIHQNNLKMIHKYECFVVYVFISFSINKYIRQIY